MFEFGGSRLALDEWWSMPSLHLNAPPEEQKCSLALLRPLFFLFSSFNCSARIATSDCQLQSLVTGPKHSTPPMNVAAVSPMNSGRNQLHCVCVHLLHLKSGMLPLLWACFLICRLSCLPVSMMHSGKLVWHCSYCTVCTPKWYKGAMWSTA